MNKLLPILAILAITTSFAEYSVRVPLELGQGGSLPSGSINIGDVSNGGQNGNGSQYDNCYDNASECFDEMIENQEGTEEDNVNVCDFRRQVSQYGQVPYDTFWFERVSYGTEFFWQDYRIGSSVQGSDKYYNNPEGGIFYRGRFIENIAAEHGGNYYEGRIYEICYYGPEWTVDPY